MPSVNIIKRKWLFIVILIVVLGVFSFVAYRMFGWQFAQELTQNTPSSFISPSTSSTSPVQEDKTNDMKTYTNIEFGFEFKYPKDWDFEENSFYSPFSKLNLEIFLPKDKGTPNSISINIVTSDFADSVVMNMEKLGAIKENIVISGINGMKYEYKQGLEKDITIDFSFREYRIISGTVKGHEDILNQILATFKFLK